MFKNTVKRTPGARPHLSLLLLVASFLDGQLGKTDTYNRRQNELRHFARKTGLFNVLLTSKGGNIAFLPHLLRAMLCPCSSYL